MKKDRAELGTLVLRIALGVAFVVAALDKVLSLPMATDMFKMLFGSDAGAGLLYLAIVIELVGGVMLLLNWHVREAAGVLALFIVVAFVTTFKLGAAPHMIGTLREVLVMNTGGGNTAVNFAYFAMLLSLVLSGCRQCK